MMFDVDLKTAMLFFWLCRRYDITDEQDKADLLVYLAKRGRVKNVIHTNRTPDQVAKDMAKNFGKVLYIKGEDKKAND